MTQLRSPARGPVQAQLLAWQLSLPEQLDSCAAAASLHRPSTHTGQLLLPPLPWRKVLGKGAPSYSPHSQELYSPPSKRQCHFGTNNYPTHSVADTHGPWATLRSRSWRLHRQEEEEAQCALLRVTGKHEGSISVSSVAA